MGRSKFPGKPSKHGNRTRVNVLATNTTANNATAAATASTAAAGAETTAGAAANTNGNAGHTERNPNVVAVDDEGLDEDDEHERQQQPNENKSKTNNLNTSSDNVNINTVETKRRPARRCRSAKKSPHATKAKKSPKMRTRRLVTTSPHHPLTRSRVTRRGSLNGSLNRSLRRERNERREREVGKFVLPSRSAHSSRVIKPNKRFLSLEQDQTRIIRKRVKRQCNVKTVTFSDHVVIVNSDSKPEATSKLSSEETEENSAKSAHTPSSTCLSSPSSGKILIRQPRLQFHTLKSPNTSLEGPFSVSTSSSPKTITCGVCGAVRFYRFVKNARKFNIFSCESCRKFITKLIKLTTTTNTSGLSCLKGHGLCHIPPHSRSQILKYGSQYNTRCPACWLKLCLRSFQIPMALKSSLTKLLPKYMQPNETNSLPLLSWQAQSSPIASTSPVHEQQTGGFKPEFGQTPLSPVQARTSPSTADNLPTSTPVAPVRQRPVRLKSQTRAAEKHIPPPPVEIKRAKVDLKGPRVKHVCRSASIVLGQLPATFPAETLNKVEETKEISKIEDKPIENKKKEKKEEPKVVKIETITTLEKEAHTCQEIMKEKEKVADKKEEKPLVLSELEIENQQINKKEKSQKQQPPLSMLPVEMTNPSFNKKCKKVTQLENPNLLNIDFWENYDPDEVVCNGYGVIATEAFPMRAICFLCGSAGKEAMVHCCVCCEPYHPYCLEQGPPKFRQAGEKFSWVCPKCTKCSACGEADKQKIHCQKCHKAYHPQCFNHKWRTDDRPTVCSNCLRCKSCGTDNITKFVGNLALCLACFKLRNKGNYCPLCQCCYDDNDFDTKMMECGKCNKWVHAKCEGLSDEQYQILSILPESVEFICCLCTTEATPFWRKAVQQELRSCLNNILRLMSKNRVAREAFKLTPLKACSPHAYPGSLHSARRLQFVDTETSDNPEDDEGDVLDEMDQVNATFKNKIDFGDSFSMSCSFLNDSKIPISPRMVEIKNKLNCNEYFSLHEFNESMESALQSSTDGKLLDIYHNILKKVLPWFDPNVKEEVNKTLDASRLDIDGPECGNKKLFEELDSVGYQFQSIESVDTRICNLCKGIGDGLPDEEARLLYCGQNEWVHANCALWSSEVYEEIDGSLQNVQSAMNRGRSIKCSQCKQKGASVGCCRKGCHETYHFPCAQKVKCHFNADRTMYCHLHDAPKDMNLITNPHDFAIRRSVYIEVDTKKKKLADRERVRYMVGSLSVMALGKVIPSISDSVDIITPVGFICSRLFWSTHEPWKLVPYKITTSMYNASAENYVDRNFTVDHSLARHSVERKLKEIYLWQKDDKERSDIYEFEDYEEPQNAGDILSPELTDAILEELPHDLLEGLSMQEMLKEYEELMNLEFRTTEINSNDNLSLNMNEKEDAIDSKEFTVRELKRSKSEVFQKIKDQNRTCSLAYLHLDNNLSPAIKKRKITTPSFMQIVQVDGACDSGSECASPTHEGEDPWAEDGNVKCEKCDSTYRTKISYERHLEHCESLFTSESETEEASGVAAEEQSQIIYESFSFQATAQNQIKSTATLLNTQTILEKTQTQTVQDAGVIYNYQSHQTVKPNIVASAQSQQGVVDSALMNAQFCLSTQQLSGPSSTASCIIPVETTTQVLNQVRPPIIEPVIQPVQPVPFSTAQDINILNLAQPTQTTITDAMEPVHQLLVRSQGVPIQQPIQQKRCLPKPRAVFTKRPIVTQQAQPRMVQVLPQFQQSPSVILQQIPSSVNMLPFVDQGGLQYMVAPQANPPQATAQLVQLPDNNFLSLVPNVQQIQPTAMIIPQRMETGQLVIDGSGMVSWAPPPIQPVYFGIETVQTTVMQSQSLHNQSHIFPTTMPGIMTTNSSYSATTQVFQTKLEPCIDGSYVIVNQVNQNQLQQVQQVPPVPSQIQLQTSVSNIQALPTLQIKQVPAPAPVQTIPTSVTIQAQQLPPPPQPIVSQISVPVAAQPAKTQTIAAQVPTTPTLATWNASTTTMPINVEVSQQIPPEMKPVQVITAPVVTTSTNVLLKTKPAQITSTVNPAVTHLISANTTNSTCNTNSITLPVAPFVPEQGIPTNIVTPTPKVAVPVQPARPMSRVLPMQTSTTQKKIEKLIVEPMLEKSDKKITVLGDVLIPKTCSPLVSLTNPPKISITPQVTYKVEVKEMNVDDIKLRAKEIKGRDMPLLAKVHKLDSTIQVDVKPTHKEKELPPIPVVIDIKPELKKSPEKTPQIQPLPPKKLEEKIETKEVLKVNKASVAPLKVPKPKITLSTIQNPTANKENIICDGNVHEPKYSKRPNTTSIYFKIESTDGFEYTATSLPQIWRKVFADVQAARVSHNLPPLPDIAVRAFNDLDIMGLKTKGLKFLVEQLPDAVKCKQYKPLYHKPKDPYQFEDDDDEDSARRCVAYDTKREKYDMFGWLTSKHRTLEMYDLDAVMRRNTSSSLPMAMRFRALRVTSKYSVGVYRSDIHGRGLFSLRDIESGEMVIEYAGEVIRSLLTDKREKYYNTKGIGCYMFRIDDNLVVDATMKGNAARFINHSCDPNCYSKVVEILGNKHIIIFALRRIICGEELTYDYKFPFEEDKIPCSCGTRRCRKFLN